LFVTDFLQKYASSERDGLKVAPIHALNYIVF